VIQSAIFPVVILQTVLPVTAQFTFTSLNPFLLHNDSSKHSIFLPSF
jgi:hypothetical protein